MAGISLGTALLGSAIIGGGAAVAGAASNSKAINSAGNANLQASRESLAAQEKARDDANTNLSPFVTSGFNALNTRNALLGIPGYDQSSARDAFNGYLDMTGFGYNMGLANDAANAQFRAAGALDSGAAVKAAQDRAINMRGTQVNNFLGLLGDQQNLGAGAASSMAGVSQNFGSNVSNILSNQGTNSANLALAQGQNTNALLGNLSSSFGLGMGAMTKFGGTGGNGGSGGNSNSFYWGV